VVPPSDHVQAADRLVALLSDQAQRQRMGARSRQIIQDTFTAEHMVQRFVALYDEVLDSKI
jgi:glycosyltransferase involved in cell wall biosynthesis